MMTSLRRGIAQEMKLQGETWKDVKSHTLTDKQLDTVFDGGFGENGGIAFTLWTASRVYFPCRHDGRDTVSSVARNPDGKATEHNPRISK